MSKLEQEWVRRLEEDQEWSTQKIDVHKYVLPFAIEYEEELLH